MRIFSYLKEKLRTFRVLLKNSRRLFMMAWSRYPGLTSWIFILAILVAALPFGRTGIMALLVNEIAGTGGGNAYLLIGLLVLASAVPSVIYDIFNYLDRKFWINMMHEFELAYAKKHGEIDVATYENPKFNDLEQRASENYYRPLNMLNSQAQLVQDLVTLITASAVLIIFSPTIFFVMLVGVFPSFIVEAKYGRDVWGIHDSKAENRRRFYDLRNRFLNRTELIELKLFQNLGRFYEQIARLLKDFDDEQRAVEKRKFVLQMFATLIAIAATGFSIVWAVRGAIGGDFEAGTLVFILTTIGSFQGAFTSFLFGIAKQLQNSLFATDMFSVFDTERTVKLPENPQKIPEGITPEIRFENVSFKYPETDTYVLKNLDLVIRPGEKLAIIGINGAGKTTFVKLLCRFYDPTEGRILVGGVDLRDIDLDEWYGMLAVLFQDYATYHFLAKEGIALGRSSKELDFDLVRKAAETSDAHTFIDQWDKKYDQMVGKEFTEGVELSRGQQQKLALARSFYREPKVLVLDEPTASVDAEAESKIFERLESMPSGVSMILISHRFSTVRKADTICVIEDGKISELGSHAELIANDKTYARLFNLQAAGYKD